MGSATLVLLPLAVHEAVVRWGRTAGLPAHTLLHDALTAVWSDPLSVGREADAVEVPAGPSLPLAVAEADADLWQRAASSLAGATRGRSLEAVVRAVVVQMLDAYAALEDDLDGALPTRPAGLQTREERVDWYAHRIMAGKLVRAEAPERIALGVLSNALAVRRHVTGELTQQWLDRWVDALKGPVAELVELMLATDEEGVDLRQVSPFQSSLTRAERLVAVRAARVLAEAGQD